MTVTSSTRSVVIIMMYYTGEFIVNWASSEQSQTLEFPRSIKILSVTQYFSDIYEKLSLGEY